MHLTSRDIAGRACVELLQSAPENAVTAAGKKVTSFVTAISRKYVFTLAKSRWVVKMKSRIIVSVSVASIGIS